MFAIPIGGRILLLPTEKTLVSSISEGKWEILGLQGSRIQLMDLVLSAAIRQMVEVPNLHHQVGLVMGINLMYDMSI